MEKENLKFLKKGAVNVLCSGNVRKISTLKFPSNIRLVLILHEYFFLKIALLLWYVQMFTWISN
jgi:hypothetical protein